MKIVVTGGAGFIGSHLVRGLQALGHEVEVFDIALDPKRDVRDIEAVREALKGVDYVFHLAAIPSVPYSIEYPEETNLTNLDGTLNVLIAARDAGVKRVMFASSAAIYGDQEILPVKESAEKRPKSPYALQKLLSERYLKLFSDIYNLETVSLRYFNVYGPGQKHTGPYASVVPIFLNQKKEGRPISIVGTGEQTRDLVHVSDVVAANLAAMTSSNVGGGESINISSGKSISINEVADIFGGPRENIPPRLEIKDSLADISLAKKLIDWVPKIDIKTGLEQLLKGQS